MQWFNKTKIDEIAELEKRKQQQQEEYQNNLKIAAAKVFNSVEGKYILAFLKDICLWGEQDPNINQNNVLYKKGRTDIWAVFRNVLPKDVLSKVEIYGIDK